VPPAARWFLLRVILTLKMEVIYFSEASVFIRTTRRNILEDGNIFQNLVSNRLKVRQILRKGDPVTS
jgi:hypothetical protein